MYPSHVFHVNFDYWWSCSLSFLNLPIKKIESKIKRGGQGPGDELRQTHFTFYICTVCVGTMVKIKGGTPPPIGEGFHPFLSNYHLSFFSSFPLFFLASLVLLHVRSGMVYSGQLPIWCYYSSRSESGTLDPHLSSPCSCQGYDSLVASV